MRFTLPINPHATSPLREGILFAGLTIALTWLFWFPGAFLPMGSLIGDLLLAVGSFGPLAVVIFLNIWLQNSSFKPLAWFKTLTRRSVLVAVLLPLMIFIPILLLRISQGTLDLGKLLSDAQGMWFSIVVLFILSLAEEIGWRAYLLPRLNTLPLFIANLVLGVLWFAWQLPLVLAGRYNESENFGSFVAAMFLYAVFITPFLNRLAMRANYNPILSAFVRTGTGFLIAVYFLQGRADPLTDTFGPLTILWLLLLNVLLFSQLWQGKRPPAQISELERVMPLEVM